MSLYGNFTLKEWLALHCNTRGIDDLFRKALKDNDEPMAVLALAELIKRDDIDLVTYAIQEATDAGYFTFGPRRRQSCSMVPISQIANTRQYGDPTIDFCQAPIIIITYSILFLAE